MFVIMQDHVISGHQFYPKQKVELIDGKLWFWTFNDEGQRGGRSYVEVTDEQLKDLIDNSIIVPI